MTPRSYTIPRSYGCLKLEEVNLKQPSKDRLLCLTGLSHGAPSHSRCWRPRLPFITVSISAFQPAFNPRPRWRTKTKAQMSNRAPVAICTHAVPFPYLFYQYNKSICRYGTLWSVLRGCTSVLHAFTKQGGLSGSRLPRVGGVHEQPWQRR